MTDSCTKEKPPEDTNVVRTVIKNREFVHLEVITEDTHIFLDSQDFIIKDIANDVTTRRKAFPNEMSDTVDMWMKEKIIFEITNLDYD